MAWKYDPFKSLVKNADIEVTFSVTKSGTEGVELEAVEPSKLNCSEEQLQKITAEASSAVQDDWIRMTMGKLVNDYFPGSYFSAANVISKKSGHKVSERTIQAWLIAPDRQSSRRCPLWALKTLEEYVSVNPEKWERLVPGNRKPGEEFADVMDRHSVEFATNRIEADKRMRERWLKSSYSELPQKLFELEKRVDEHLLYLNEALVKINSAFRNAKNCDDLIATVVSSMSEHQNINLNISETRKAIEAGIGEFSNEEGVLD